MNIYKNGYLLHAILGFSIYEYFRDFGMLWAMLAVVVFAIGKEIHDAVKAEKVGTENIIDILCTCAGCILAIFGEILKSYVL